MKKILLILLAIVLFLTSCGTKSNEYILNEKTFFLVMTNILYYPEQYDNATLELDCFTYEIEDINGNKYLCGVRKCSAGYGCKCGKDSVIGFILNSEEELPEPKNQSVDTNDKTWIHLKGNVDINSKKEIEIYAYDNGTIEKISFLTFNVTSFNLIDDYSNLAYYVTK